MIKESHIQRACLDLLEALRLRGAPVVATRTNSGRVKSVDGRWLQLCRPGWPDITAVIKGRFVAIETKSPTGTMDETQKLMRSIVEAAGGVYLLVNRLAILRDYLDKEGLLHGRNSQ